MEKMTEMMCSLERHLPSLHFFIASLPHRTIAYIQLDTIITGSPMSVIDSLKRKEKEIQSLTLSTHLSTIYELGSIMNIFFHIFDSLSVYYYNQSLLNYTLVSFPPILPSLTVPENINYIIPHSLLILNHVVLLLTTSAHSRKVLVKHSLLLPHSLLVCGRDAQPRMAVECVSLLMIQLLHFL